MMMMMMMSSTNNIFSLHVYREAGDDRTDDCGNLDVVEEQQD